MKQKSNNSIAKASSSAGLAKSKSAAQKSKTSQREDVIDGHRPGFDIATQSQLAGMELSSDLQQDVIAETAAIKQQLRDADKRVAERYQLLDDTEYFAVLLFESREQKEIFLKAMNWIIMGDKYLDGTEIARRLGIPLPKVHFPVEKPNQRKAFTPLIDDDLT